MSAASPTLSALAAILGEMEPPGDAADLTLAHLERLDVLVNAARMAPVTSPADAALALSAAAFVVADLHANKHTPAERDAMLEDVQSILGQLRDWMRDSLGAAPLASMWPASRAEGRA